MADGLSVADLAQAVVAVCLVARVGAFVRLAVTGSIRRAVVILYAVDAEAAEISVVGVTSGGRWTRASRLMIDDSAQGVGSTYVRASEAGIGTRFSHLTRFGFERETGELFRALNARLALIGRHAAGSIDITVSNRSLTTSTTERAGSVGTDGCRVTRRLSGTFVNIDTTVRSTRRKSWCASALVGSANLARSRTIGV